MHPDLMVCAVASTAEPGGGEEEVSVFVNGVLHSNYLTRRQTGWWYNGDEDDDEDGWMVVTDVPAHSHIECDFWISTLWWETVRQPSPTVLVVHNDISKKWSSELSKSVHIRPWYLSVTCILPVSPCSAAVPRHFHICGGGSSCRLCSAGRASPCFPPRTPRVWLLYLIDTHMSGTGLKMSNTITHTHTQKTKKMDNTGKDL